RVDRTRSARSPGKGSSPYAEDPDRTFGNFVAGLDRSAWPGSSFWAHAPGSGSGRTSMALGGARLAALVAAFVIALLAGTLQGASDAEARPRNKAKVGRDNSSEFRWCRLQKPQSFLKRANFVKNGQLQGRAHDKAVRYRVEHY